MVKHALEIKLGRLSIRMNFIKHRNSGLIVLGKKITMCKHMDSIQITRKVNHEENLIEEILSKDIEIHEEISLEIENNLIKQVLEALIEKLKKKDVIIGENHVKNINRVNIICTLERINHDLRITHPVIKSTPL